MTDLKKQNKSQLFELAKSLNLPTEVDGKELTKAQMIELIETYEKNNPKSDAPSEEPGDSEPAVVPGPEIAEGVGQSPVEDNAWIIARNRKLSIQIGQIRDEFAKYKMEVEPELERLQKENGQLKKELRKLASEKE